MRLRATLMVGLLALSATALVSVSFAADDAAPVAPTTQPAAPSSEDVMSDLGQMVEPNPLSEPPPASTTKAAPAPPEVSASFDPGVLGVAPGQPKPKIRREGEFIVNRKGRLIRSSGGQSMFLFDADSENAAETPMPLLPCQMLQNIEDLARERGDSIAFILSGQILLYRNTNFLMPTMMKLDTDRGNLQR